MSTVFLVVGLPAAGKSTRARELERGGALRLTTDEWVVPVFGGQNPEAGRDALEGQLIRTALEVARRGVDVVLDFGFWSRDERTALRALFADAGARCVVEFCDVAPDVQRARVQQRWRERPHTTFPIGEDELETWRGRFETPGADELAPSSPPPRWADWADWTARRWPGYAGWGPPPRP